MEAAWDYTIDDDLKEVSALLADLGLALPSMALQNFEPSSTAPMIWCGRVVLFVTDVDGATTLLLFGADGVEQRPKILGDAAIHRANVCGNLLIAFDFIAHSVVNIYVWQADLSNGRVFAFPRCYSASDFQSCGCARANCMFQITLYNPDGTRRNELCMLGVEACDCADDSTALWHYKHMEPMQLEKGCILSWGGTLDILNILQHPNSAIRSFSNIEDPIAMLAALANKGISVRAPFWSPERHWHHHPLVRAVVREMLLLLRSSSCVRLPPRLQLLLVARLADVNSAALCDLAAATLAGR